MLENEIEEREKRENFDTFCNEEGLGSMAKEEFQAWLSKTKKTDFRDRTQEEWTDLLEEFDDLEEDDFEI
jgi:hypothetical protein